MTPAAKDRAWDMAFKVMVPISFILAGTLIAHEVRLKVIESSRFTTEQGRVMEQRMEEKYDRLSELVGRVKVDVAVIREILERP
jgi:hypothetical protein